MRKGFYLDGVFSRDLGILVTAPQIHNSPAADVDYTSVPGRSGDLVTDNERYENVTVTYSCAMFGNLNNKMTRIKSWLNASRGYRKLWDTWDSDYFRYASFSASIEPDIDGEYAEFDIEFNCQPFRYKQGINSVKFSTTSNGLMNPEPFASRPKIQIKGTGGYIKIGDQQINISAIDEYVDIDTETQNATKGTVNKNSTIDTADISLLPGKNIITISNGITSIWIDPRWRTL